MIPDDDDVDVAVMVDFVKQETAKAYLFVVGGEETWVAKSQILNDEGLTPGDENVEVQVPQWLAEENGWT